VQLRLRRSELQELRCRDVSLVEKSLRVVAGIADRDRIRPFHDLRLTAITN
jgi:integrase